MKNSLRTFLSKEGQQAMKILNLNVQKRVFRIRKNILYLSSTLTIYSVY